MTVALTRIPPASVGYRPRHVLMCPPEFFTVSYEINPWMHRTVPVDRKLAMRQWNTLVRVYEALGHTVEFVEPVLGLPDMVFAANGGLVVDGRVYPAKFRHAERQGEESPYAGWFAAHGFVSTGDAAFVNEGEGDFATVGDPASDKTVLAGFGFRTDIAAHEELRGRLGLDVVSLRLVDPRYYHLDTALAVLSDDNIAYNPEAFDAPSRRWLAMRFPHAIAVNATDAAAFACNSFSDGHHVVVPAGASMFATQLKAAGYDPITVDLSEFRKSGGSVKCCTLELRSGGES
jgi:N-dimethylarginine dimethylaminohydrolase